MSNNVDSLLCVITQIYRLQVVQFIILVFLYKYMYDKVIRINYMYLVGGQSVMSH